MSFPFRISSMSFAKTLSTWNSGYWREPACNFDLHHGANAPLWGLVQTLLVEVEGSATGRRAAVQLTSRSLQPSERVCIWMSITTESTIFSFVNFYSATSSNLALWVSPVAASNEIFSAVLVACRVSSLLRMRHSDAVDARMQLIEQVPLSVPRCGIW